jgi:predicted nucleotidyltransferase component of viral defense system
MIGLREVQKLAYEQQVSEQSIERDYVLTWILAELSRHPSLGKATMLKGGTALKKLFYSEWRYSEDLDFTLSTSWAVEAITTAIGEVCVACLPSAGLEVNIAKEEPRYDGNKLRSMTIYIAYIGPLRRTRRPRELKMDFTADEIIVAKPVKRPLQRMYSDEAKPPRKVLCYILEEIFAEKNANHPATHGATRSLRCLEITAGACAGNKFSVGKKHLRGQMPFQRHGDQKLRRFSYRTKN